MAVILDICDAVVTRLNSQSFSVAFTAIRKYRPPQALEDIEGENEPRVFVFPAAIATVESPSARSRVRLLDYEVAIGIWKVLDITTDSNVDAYLDLMEEIDDDLRTAGKMSVGSWQDSDSDPLYDEDLFDQFQVFQTINRIQYRVQR